MIIRNAVTGTVIRNRPVVFVLFFACFPLLEAIGTGKALASQAGLQSNESVPAFATEVQGKSIPAQDTPTGEVGAFMEACKKRRDTGA